MVRRDLDQCSFYSLALRVMDQPDMPVTILASENGMQGILSQVLGQKNSKLDTISSDAKTPIILLITFASLHSVR